jgi:Domain of unknown function (DUF222)/HNH endonuclease
VRLADANRAHERRHVAYSWDDDGTLALRARLAPEEGAIVLRALDAARDELNNARREGGRDGAGEPLEVRASARPSNADALVALAEASLASDASTRSGGDAHQVIVHLDTNESARLDDGPAIAHETARRILCDASLVAIAERDSEPLTVGRKTRSVPGAIRRALRERDGGCRFPGCSNRRFTDAHHIHHWADGGETSAANMVLLCRPHHRLLHEGGFSIEREANDELIFRGRDGRLLERCPAAPRSRARDLGARMRRRPGPSIGPETCVPRFGGDRLDRDIAVEGLLVRSKARGP